MLNGIRTAVSAFAMATVVAIAASGCGEDDGGGNAAADPANVSGTVTYWDTASEAEAPAYEKLIDAFEKKYPKITVNRVYVPFDQALQKFKTAAQAKKGAPDVLRSDVGWTPGFASLGYLAPLDGTPALTDTGDYLEGPLKGAKLNGKTYAAPQVTDTLALLYNKEILAAAGIAEPPATWEEVQDAAEKIKQRVPGVTTTYVNPDSYYAWPFLFGEGGDMVDVDARRITVNSPESIKGVQAAVDLIDSGAANVPDTTEGYNNMQAQMASGKLAMIVNGPWATGDLLKGSAFTGKEANLGIAPIPGGTAGFGAPTGGHNLAVYAASRNLDASYLFVAFMNAPENQAEIAVANDTLPTRKSAYTDEVTADPVRAAFKDTLDAAQPRAPLATGDLFANFNEHYAKILTGEVSVRDGLNATAKDWKSKYLKDYELL